MIDYWQQFALSNGVTLPAKYVLHKLGTNIKQAEGVL